MLEIRRPDGTVSRLDFEQFEESVRAGHITADFEIRFGPVTGDAFVPAGSLELFRSILDDPRTRFVRRFDLRKPPPVTLILAALLGAVFVWQIQSSGVLNAAALIRQGAKSMAHQVELGERWRLASASLLHSGWLHLVPNLLFLLYVGRNVEAVLGSSGMVLLLVASGVGSMAASSLATDAATVGASGMTFGVFGAAIALGWRYGAWLPRSVRVRYGWPIVPFVAYFLVVGLTWQSVDNFCHLGGLLVGGTLGMVLPSSLAEKERDLPMRLLRVGAAGAVLGVVLVALPLASSAGVIPTGHPRRVPVVAAEAGYSVRPPAGWEPLGRPGPGWRSATGGAQLTARAWIEELAVPSDEAVRRRWVDELSESGVVLPREGPSADALGLPDGWFSLESDVVAGDQALRSLRVGVVRGLYVTTLEFLHPVDHYADYDRLRRAVLGTVETVEPRAVVRALEALHGGTLADGEDVARALDAVPARVGQAPAEALRLAAELARYGEGERARFLLEALGAGGATSPEVDYWSLWIAHHLDGGTGPDGPGRVRELAARQPDSLPAAALCFDVLVSAGYPDEARVVLVRMQERWPARLPVLTRAALLPPPGPR